MTNKLGPGTVNVPVNMFEEEKRILGKLAFKLDLSMGALIRTMVRESVEKEHPAVAAQLAAARLEAKQRIQSAILLMIAIFSIVASWLPGSQVDDFRRASASVRVVRSARRRDA